VLYLIRNGGLPAEKLAGSWFIDSEHLPLEPEQQSSADRKQRQFKAAVEEALAIAPESEQKRYSVRDLKAFQIALPLYQKACQALTADHPASQALKRVLELLSQGCHRFDRQEKAEVYRAAATRPVWPCASWCWPFGTRRSTDPCAGTGPDGGAGGLMRRMDSRWRGGAR